MSFRIPSIEKWYCPFTYLVHSYASFLKAVNALSLQYEKITKPEPFS